MAKKSTSVTKTKAKAKPAKAKSTIKAASKPTKKPMVKALKKLVTKVVKKVTAATKAVETKGSKVAKKANTSGNPPPTKSKPALMTKKGKAVVESEPVVEAIESVEADTDASPAKAEKTSKVKPIRIEKGNLDDEKAKWAELFKKYGKEKAVGYKMSDTFPAMSPIQHKVLGWGFILKNDNDRLEVLFETGIRMLISNYKA